MVFTMNLAHLLVLFSIKSRRRPKAVQGAQRDPTGTPGRPKGSQRTANGSPKAPEREPKARKPPTRSHKSDPGRRSGAQGHPKGSQRESKVVPKESQVTPKTPKGSQPSITYLQTPDQPPQRTLCYNDSQYIFVYFRILYVFPIYFV